MKPGYRSNAFRWLGGVAAPAPKIPVPPIPDTGTGLKYEFEPDLYSTFLNSVEFGDVFTFKIVENGHEKQFTTCVVWDTETLKERAIVQEQGVFLGTVLCFIPMELLPVEPKPEQIIYRQRAVNPPYWEGWRVIDIVDAEYCYELYLDKLLS